MPLSQGSELVFQGGIRELANIPLDIDNAIAPGSQVQLQLRLRFHVPLLADNVRFLMEQALGDDLIAVTFPASILRIVWKRNLGPIAVAAILISVAIIVTLLILFLLFVTAPEAAEKAVGGLGLILILAVVALGLFTRRKR